MARLSASTIVRQTAFRVSLLGFISTSHDATPPHSPQLPADALTLRQVLQIRMHDALQPLQSNCERLRQELAEARESARTMQDSMTQELRQANHRAAIAEAQAAGLRGQHALQEATATRLSSRVDELLRQARTVDP
jgi:hypothetical protein